MIRDRIIQRLNEDKDDGKGSHTYTHIYRVKGDPSGRPHQKYFHVDAGKHTKAEGAKMVNDHMKKFSHIEPHPKYKQPSAETAGSSWNKPWQNGSGFDANVAGHLVNVHHHRTPENKAARVSPEMHTYMIHTDSPQKAEKEALKRHKERFPKSILLHQPKAKDTGFGY